ncbi:NXPE family member 3-like isoform X2 [Asterias rubens]|uniref:NXPE family member 3-like isoform X2 n=1 Tax=Asterias rubens TaxID=7604 RepID=UPI0014556056|nr:NXPE family member 3-like isoform X2 [Asterias rubens]
MYTCNVVLKETNRSGIVSSVQNAGGSPNIAVDEKKSLFRPRHKEVPVQPIKKPYEPKLSYENDICFRKTSNLSKTPWDKCKMSFVPPNVTLVSPPLDNITIGDDVHYRIESNKLEIPRDGCVSGGNFWFAVLTSVKNPKASCAGSVTDYCNGTYDVHVTAAWAGNATFELTLVHTGEAINHLRNIVWPAQDRLAFSGYYKANNQTDVSKMPQGFCYVRRRGNWSGYCEYPNKKAMGMTTTICEKVDGVPCDTLNSMKSHSSKITHSAMTLTENVHYLFTSPNFRNPVNIPDSKITIKGGNESLSDPLPRCHPDQPIPSFQGYWYGDNWHSRICAVDDKWIEAPNVRKCVSNRNVVLLGDSTTRAWFHIIHSMLGVRGQRQADDVSCCYFNRVYKPLNATMVYSIHPHVLASYGVYLKDVRFEVDVLDGLRDPTCNYIVVVSPWAHFSQWTRESYIERTTLLREAIIRLRRRCPDVPIVVKGPHPREHSTYVSVIFANDYLLRQIGLINQELFGGIGVWFLPVWDMNMAHPHDNVVHMPQSIVREEIKMFFSFVCA